MGRRTGIITSPVSTSLAGPSGARFGRIFFILSEQWFAPTDAAMPSLLRFLVFLGVLAGLTYGAMFALAHYYDPKPREITVSVPPDRFAKQR
jgi:hypothetical protein